MSRAIPLLPLYVFMEWCLVKHRDNFTFTFKPERKSPVGRLEQKWQLSIKIGLKYIFHEDTDWIQLDQDRIQWRLKFQAS
jgi:hypothetical protein